MLWDRKRLSGYVETIVGVTDKFYFSVKYLLESDIQAACDTEGTSMLVQLGPEH